MVEEGVVLSKVWLELDEKNRVDDDEQNEGCRHDVAQSSRSAFQISTIEELDQQRGEAEIGRKEQQVEGVFIEELCLPWL